MKIAITGGSGFIGTRLIDILIKENHNIFIIDKKKSKKYPELSKIIDIRDKDDLIKILDGVDIIIHLAAEHVDSVSPASLYYDVNVDGTANLIEAARTNGIKKLIFTSSVAVYGLNRPEPNEEDEPRPFEDYGKSKWQAEGLLNAWYNSDKQNSLTIIRPVVVFGENNRGNVYNLIRQIISGAFIKVGSGKNRKSMAYVGNVAMFLARQIDNPAGFHLFIYADKPDLTMNEFVNLVYNAYYKKDYHGLAIPCSLGMLGGYFFDFLSFLSGKKLPIKSLRIKKFCATTQFSSQKALSSGFEPHFTLKEAFFQTIKHEFGDN